jgi:hypothetical protein
LKNKPTVHLGHKRLNREKGNPGGITIPKFKLHYRAIAIKTAWYWHRNRYEHQWNIREEPNMNLHIYT